MLPEDWEDKEYGRKTEEWYNKGRYEREVDRRGEGLTLRDRVVERIKSKPWGWMFLVGLVAALSAKKFGRLEVKRVLVRRGFEVGVVMCVLSLTALMLRGKRKEVVVGAIKEEK